MASAATTGCLDVTHLCPPVRLERCKCSDSLDLAGGRGGVGGISASRGRAVCFFLPSSGSLCPGGHCPSGQACRGPKPVPAKKQIKCCDPGVLSREEEDSGQEGWCRAGRRGPGGCPRRAKTAGAHSGEASRCPLRPLRAIPDSCPRLVLLRHLWLVTPPEPWACVRAGLAPSLGLERGGHRALNPGPSTAQVFGGNRVSPGCRRSLDGPEPGRHPRTSPEHGPPHQMGYGFGPAET